MTDEQVDRIVTAIEVGFDDVCCKLADISERLGGNVKSGTSSETFLEMIKINEEV